VFEIDADGDLLVVPEEDHGLRFVLDVVGLRETRILQVLPEALLDFVMSGGGRHGPSVSARRFGGTLRSCRFCDAAA
jgi:hypothetical protein